MVANQPQLLPFSHPSQQYLHVPFACQASQAGSLQYFKSTQDQLISTNSET